MMNVFDQQNHLPATEALDAYISRRRLPEPEYRRAQTITPSVLNEAKDTCSRESAPKKKRSFDMAELLSATEPVEQAIAFPTIEWCRDDEESDDEPDNDMSEPHESLSQDDDDLEDERYDYFPSKRSRLRLGLSKSKSVKTSLCSMGDESSRDGKSRSWGHFLSDEVEVPTFSIGSRGSPAKHKRGNSFGRSRREQMDLNILIAPLA